MYAPREQQDANDYSERLGTTTVRKRNRSRSYGQQGNTTLSENEERRALMLPQELKAIGFDKEVFFYEGIPHPVLCDKIKYFKDKHFTQRLLPKVKIKTLQIGDGRMPNKVQDTVSAMAMLALTACAVQPVAGTAQAAPQEISQTAQAALGESATPTNPAEALGQKLLKLIDSLKTIDDLTVERINDMMGVELEKRAGEGSYKLTVPLADRWSYYLTFEMRTNATPPRLRLDVVADGPQSKISTRPCPDFEDFSDALIVKGYLREAHYARFASVQTSWAFYRPDSDIERPNSGEFPSGGNSAVDINIPLVPEEEIESQRRHNACFVSIQISNWEN